MELYQGTLIHDHEATFQNYGMRTRSLVHVERYVRSSIENEPKLKWNKQMLEWIRSSIHYYNGIQEGAAVDEEQVAQFEARYDEIIEKAREEYEYEPPSGYFRDGYNLYKRMSDDQEDYLLFLHDPSVEPSNNLAERSGRSLKER